jgi:hypothetical protein
MLTLYRRHEKFRTVGGIANEPGTPTEEPEAVQGEA